jgi:hypothetical protein
MRSRMRSWIWEGGGGWDEDVVGRGGFEGPAYMELCRGRKKHNRDSDEGHPSYRDKPRARARV